MARPPVNEDTRRPATPNRGNGRRDDDIARATRAAAQAVREVLDEELPALETRVREGVQADINAAVETVRGSISDQDTAQNQKIAELDAGLRETIAVLETRVTEVRNVVENPHHDLEELRRIALEELRRRPANKRRT